MANIAPAVPTYASLPEKYWTGFKTFVGDPTEYYSSRGAEKSAQNDYYNMLNLWQNKTGVPLTDDDWDRVWGGLQAYRTGNTVPGMERAWTMSDAVNYLGRMLASAPQRPNVAYLKTGEI